jgi:hypothetical protein
MIFNIQVSKINTVESFDDTKLPEVSKVHVFNYGLTQLLNDAHAGCTEKAYPVEADRLAEARRRVGLKVDQIRTGQGLKTSVVSPVLVAQAKEGLTDEDMIEAMALIKAAKAKAAATKKSAA